MSKEPVNQSAYSDYLYQKIDQYAEQVGHGFTVYDIAAFAGLKVTGNLRRRINHCVATGKLHVRPHTYTEHGYCNLYVIPSQLQEGDLPF